MTTTEGRQRARLSISKSLKSGRVLVSWAGTRRRVEGGSRQTLVEGMPHALRSLAQSFLIAFVRPYVVREWLGWGSILGLFCGWKRDWLWAAASTRTIRNKLTGQLITLDPANWPDRLTLFLGRWYDLETQLLTSSIVKEGDTVIDIGANRGMFALFASSIVGSAGKVICFEPNPKCVELLQRDARLNCAGNIEVHNIGLGDREQELVLTIPFVNSGEATFGATAYDEERLRRTCVPVKRGDDLLSAERPVMIKVDTEGFEPRVLAGLKDTIDRCYPVIVTEVAPGHLKSCGSSVRDLVTRMERHGYQGVKLELVKNSGKYCLALNRNWDAGESCDVAWIHPHHLAAESPFSRAVKRLLQAESGKIILDSVPIAGSAGNTLEPALKV